MAQYGITVQTAFLKILETALPNIDEYNTFVPRETLPRPKLIEFGIKADGDGELRDQNKLGEVRQAIAKQLFQDFDALMTWVKAIKRRYDYKRPVSEAIDLFEAEKAKPSLWIISDYADYATSFYEDNFFKKTVVNRLKSDYRLDEYTPLKDRNSDLNMSVDEKDFIDAGCIIVWRSQGSDSTVGDLINNIINIAARRIDRSQKLPPIVFTSSTTEGALELRQDITRDWIGEGDPPFLFLIPSDDQVEVAIERDKAEDFFRGVKPPPPLENDLVILIGGRITGDVDLARFNELKDLLGDNKSVVVVDPWTDADQTLKMHVELEPKLKAAKKPLLIEHVGERDSESAATVFADYLNLCVFRPLDALKSMVAKASKNRILWMPASTEPKRAVGAAINTQDPKDLAMEIGRRLGRLETQGLLPAAYVAAEEVVIENKMDIDLRRAFKKHLSILVGGDGNPPSDAVVEPFSFRFAGTDDPLHVAVQNFRQSQTNLVVACELSRGVRAIEEYLTDISARVGVGVNKYFSNNADDAPRSISYILVRINAKKLDNELVDKLDKHWRVVKFRRRAGEADYQPFGDDIETARAWVNSQ